MSDLSGFADKLRRLLPISLRSAPVTTLETPASAPKQERAKPNDEAHIREQAKRLGIQIFENFSTFTFDKSLTKQVPYSFVKKHLFLPIMTRGSAVLVATFDPFNMDAIEELRLLLKANIETIFVPKHAILAAIHECYTQEDAPESTSNKTASQVRDEFQETDGEIYDLLDDSSEMSPAIKLINFAVGDAIQQNASDIHFEPEERGLIIRYRIDGALQVRLSTSNDVTQQLLTRLKVMAKLDIAERRLPQDGRVKMRLGGKIVDFRVSTVPTVTGERIVLRILDKGNIVLGLDKICMPPDMLQRFREGIDHPEGIILVTGPTGSGKTTTLYSALTELKNDDTNIMTIEDPVEYRLQGIAQIGIHPKIGLTFAAGLRHILRQDPDIIMIGEIRDRETAEIAIQAALTGHLVLSTLHTNDAPSAIVRLVDMGIEPYLISSCVIGVLAQRLVRKICPYCRISYEPSKTERTSVGTSITELYKGKGCPECLESGFKGRQGIYELMTITGDIRKQILISPEATALHNVATRHGMKTLRDHGMQLIQEGTTTLEEVWRATKSNDE